MAHNKYLSISNPKIQAIGWIIIAKIAFVLMMTVVRMETVYSSLQLNFMRSVGVLSWIIPIIFYNKKPDQSYLSLFKTAQPKIQLLRVLCGSISMMLLFYGYRELPLAKASALNFSNGLFIPLMAMIFLKEKITGSRWICLGLGYMGVMIIINPTYDRFEPAELAILSSVILYSFTSVQIKRLTKTDKSSILVFYSGLTTSILLGIYYLTLHLFPSLCNPSFQPLISFNSTDMLLWISMGFLSLIGQFSYVQAYRKAQLNFLAGFEYLKLIFATLIGFFLLNEIPNWQTMVGSILILITSYFMTHQELKKNKV